MLCRHVHAVLPDDIVAIISRLHIQLYVMRASALHKRIRLIGRIGLAEDITKHDWWNSYPKKMLFVELYEKIAGFYDYVEHIVQKHQIDYIYPIVLHREDRYAVWTRAQSICAHFITVTPKYREIFNDIRKIFDKLRGLHDSITEKI